jgi:hypothetical protein
MQNHGLTGRLLSPFADAPAATTFPFLFPRRSLPTSLFSHQTALTMLLAVPRTRGRITCGACDHGISLAALAGHRVLPGRRFHGGHRRLHVTHLNDGRRHSVVALSLAMTAAGTTAASGHSAWSPTACHRRGRQVSIRRVQGHTVTFFPRWLAVSTRRVVTGSTLFFLAPGATSSWRRSTRLSDAGSHGHTCQHSAHLWRLDHEPAPTALTIHAITAI